MVAVGSWEVGAGAGRFCKTSSGGGTGRTTGEALEGSLLTNKTSIGPDVLLRRIWYFRCPLRTCRHAHSEIQTQQQQDLKSTEKKQRRGVAYRFGYGHLELGADRSTDRKECVACGRRIGRFGK